MNKNMNRIISVSVIILLLTVVLPGSNAECDESEETLFSGGCGKQNDPWLISSEEEFLNISVSGSKFQYYKLIKDIKLHDGFDSISNDGDNFNGVFDGNYHFLKYSCGYNKDMSLFKHIGETSKISNLNVEFQGTIRENGAVIALENHGDIRNCHTYGKIDTYNIEGTVHMGGYVIYNSGKIINCTNDTELDCEGDNCYAGGFASMSKGGIFMDCLNNGKIHAGGDNRNYVGGLFGKTNASGTQISNFINMGELKVKYGNVSSVGYIADSVTAENVIYNGNIYDSDQKVSRGYEYDNDVENDIHFKNDPEFVSKQTLSEGEYTKLWGSDWVPVADKGIMLNSPTSINNMSVVNHTRGHVGIDECIPVIYDLIFENGKSITCTSAVDSEDRTEEYLKLDINGMTASCTYNSLKPSNIKKISDPDKFIFEYGKTIDLEGAEFMLSYSDGTTGVLNTLPDITDTHYKDGICTVSIAYETVSTTLTTYYHMGDEFGILIYTYQDSEPIFKTCKKGEMIELPVIESNDKYEMKGWKLHSGQAVDFKDGMMVPVSDSIVEPVFEEIPPPPTLFERFRAEIVASIIGLVAAIIYYMIKG